MGKRKTERYVDTVIIENKKVSISKLRSEAKAATYRFWALVMTLGLIGSMVLPYMSYAAVASTSSAAFTGTVIPGYSMGGVEITAYGIDINSWGMVDSDTVVGSTYGVWSPSKKNSRLEAAQKAISTSGGTSDSADGTASSVLNMTSSDKAEGWYSITGKTSYSLSNPDGVADATSSNRYDTVSPYRTQADSVFWDSQKATSSGAASADINVSLYADFIIVTIEGNDARVLDNPDSLSKGSSTDGTDNGTAGTTAVPYYVPLSALFDAYSPKEVTIESLMEAISSGTAADLKKVAESNNLLESTLYKDVNGGTNDSSDAFNPYPYSMVFSKETDNGTVVSSVYNNSEAYVYFSPASVYNSYMTLREEYESIRSNAENKLDEHDPVTTFQLGYYLAEMAILEAYLDEALPQDMTRGYVGASEPMTVAKDSGASISSSENKIKSVVYSPLMYSVATRIDTSTYNSEGTTEDKTWDQKQINAVMDTLSVFGYNAAQGKGPQVQYGVMRGSARDTVFNRFTALTPYSSTASTTASYSNADPVGPIQTSEGDANVGIYTAPYYPIQQHKMPTSERTYRFQILSSVPYSTVVGLIKTNSGLSTSVTMIKTAAEMDDSSSINLDNLQSADSLSSATSKLAALVAQYNEAWEGGTENDLQFSDVNDNITNSIAISSGDGNTDTTSALSHFDSALMGYSSSSMNSANVHDLLDILRAVKGLKEETWNRFYNPIKSDGGDTDFFVTRITPANTTYFPATLVNGYTPAGGVKGYTSNDYEGDGDYQGIDTDLTTINCSFDYFCIPSFAPCFASHTADDCYYGVLNYELRVFYSTRFIQNAISESAGVPVAAEYEEMKAQLEAAQKAAAEESGNAWVDICNLYVMAKRLAFIQAARTMWTEGVTDEELRAYTAQSAYHFSLDGTNLTVSNQQISGSLGDKTYTFDDIKEGTTDEEDKGKGTWTVIRTEKAEDGTVTSYGDTIAFADNMKTADEMTFDSQWGNDTSGYSCHADSNDDYAEKWPTGTSGKFLKVNTDTASTAGGVGGAAAGAVTGGVFAGPLGFIVGGVGGWFAGSTAASEAAAQGEKKLGLMLYNSDINTCCLVYHDQWYNAVYQHWFNAYLGSENGTYYWAPADEISKALENKTYTPTVSAGGGAYGADEWQQHSVFFNWGDGDILTNKKLSDSEVQSKYEEAMREGATEISKFYENIVKDIKMYSNSMPSSMQNCLAWADYQNTTDSEAQYQVDPSDANVTVNVSTTVEDDDDGEGEEVPLSKKDLEGDGFEWDMTTGAITSKSTDGDGSSDDEDTKMVRGVEGATATASDQASCYSISATTGRITALASTSGTTYPYSGLANGRLESGADQYALLQAHVVDYTSIANGIAGDLATRSRAQVVDIINPEYSSITDFLDILSNLGALVSEIGTGMIRAAAGAYSDVSSNSSSSATQVQTSSTATSHSAVAAYQLSDGTLMNRLPASAASFDTSTGDLSYNVKKVSSTSSLFTVGSGNNTASAALFTANSASNFILENLSGLYQVIQTLALMIVLVSIVYIAFRNFYAYTMADDARMLSAQTQLKTVLPRTVIAIIMIGLPPVGSGATGFEGVNYLILRVLDNVMQYIIALFSNLGTESLINTLTSLAMTDFNIGMAIIFLLCCLVIALCFVLGVILRFLQMLILAGFFLLGPLAWSFYVWPDKASGSGLEKLAPSAGHNTSSSGMLRSVGGKVDGGTPVGGTSGGQGLAQMIGQKMNLSIFTGRQGGSSAAMGHITMFIQVELLSVIWAVLIWAFAMVLVTLSGASNTSAGTATAATLSGMSSASASILGALTGSNDSGPLNWLLIMLLTVILFLLMLSTFLNFLRGLKNLATETLGAVGGAIKDVASPVVSAAANVADAAAGVTGFAGHAKDAAKAIQQGATLTEAMQRFDKMKKISELGKTVKDGLKDPKSLLGNAKNALDEATKNRENIEKQLENATTDEERAELQKQLAAAEDAEKAAKKNVAALEKGSRLNNLSNMLQAASSACQNKEEGVLASLAGAAAGTAQAGLKNQLAQNEAAQKVLDKLQAAGPEGYTAAFNRLSGAEKALAANALGLTGNENNAEAMAKLTGAQTALNNNKEALNNSLDMLNKNTNALGVGQATMKSFDTAQTVNLANKQVRQLENSGAETKDTLSHMLGEDGSFNYDNIGLSARKPSAALIEKKALAESYEKAGMLEEAKAAKAEYAQMCLEEDLDAAGLDEKQKNKYMKAIDSGDYKTAAALTGGAISAETMAAFNEKAQLELATGSDPTKSIHQAAGIAKALNECGNNVGAIKALDALEPLTNNENLDKGLKTEIAMTRADVYQKAGYSIAQQMEAKEATLQAALAAQDSDTATVYMQSLQAMGEKARAEHNLVGALMACNKSAAAADALVAANALSSEQAAAYRSTIADIFKEGDYSMAQQQAALAAAQKAIEKSGGSTAAIEQAYIDMARDTSNGQMACLAAANAAQAAAIASGDKDRIKNAAEIRTEAYRAANLSQVQLHDALQDSLKELSAAGIDTDFIKAELQNITAKAEADGSPFAEQWKKELEGAIRQQKSVERQQQSAALKEMSTSVLAAETEAIYSVEEINGKEEIVLKDTATVDNIISAMTRARTEAMTKAISARATKQDRGRIEKDIQSQISAALGELPFNSLINSIKNKIDDEKEFAPGEAEVYKNVLAARAKEATTDIEKADIQSIIQSLPGMSSRSDQEAQDAFMHMLKKKSKTANALSAMTEKEREAYKNQWMREWKKKAEAKKKPPLGD